MLAQHEPERRALQRAVELGVIDQAEYARLMDLVGSSLAGGIALSPFDALRWEGEHPCRAQIEALLEG